MTITTGWDKGCAVSGCPNLADRQYKRVVTGDHELPLAPDDPLIETVSKVETHWVCGDCHGRLMNGDDEVERRLGWLGQWQ